MRRVPLALLTLLLAIVPGAARSQANSASCPPGSKQCDWRRVLAIGAHPDDEDTGLISWLQRGGRAETAYLSLTRGDGGQNLIGDELGEALGVIRTEELLAARRVDGAHQYFTRAYDFGFSKSAAETYAHWPKDSVLGDVVKIVRAFRPHVIVGFFDGTPRDGHGQHQVSALLAREAYVAAADVKRFPESTFGPAWTPLKYYTTARFNPELATLQFNVGEYNPSMGKSYAEVAGESRSQHKSQGFGALQRKGVVWSYVRRDSTRVNPNTPPKQEKSLFDGIEALPPSSTVEGWRPEANNALALEAISDRQYVAVGDSARVTATFYNRSRKPVTLVRGSGNRASFPEGGVEVKPDSVYRWTFHVRAARLTQPWWLAMPRNGDLFAPQIPILSPEMIAEHRWSGTAEDQREKSDWIYVGVDVPDANGLASYVTSPIVYRYADPIRGDVQRPIAVAPAISVTLDRTTELARANIPIERFFNVTLRSALLKPAPVTVSLVLPAGLSADSASRTITLDSAATRTVTFRVRGRLAPGVHEVAARASAAGTTYRAGYVPIDYEHITPERMYRPAEVTLHAVDLKVPAETRIGYIHGVGDNVEPALAQLGIPVTVIQPRAIPTVDLSRFSAVVVGPRAYQASNELKDNNSYLLDYTRNGGTLVVQYGQYEMMQPGVMPYAISIARPHDRVTEEVAPITILDPSSVVLRRPNVITPGDFAGWIQERSLYMPRTFDPKYHSIVALNDPGEPPNQGGIMVAQYGKGLYVYTTLAFFRQLPAGVSGATKLFVNLLSMTNGGSGSRSAGGLGR